MTADLEEKAEAGRQIKLEDVTKDAIDRRDHCQNDRRPCRVLSAMFSFHIFISASLWTMDEQIQSFFMNSISFPSSSAIFKTNDEESISRISHRHQVTVVRHVETKFSCQNCFLPPPGGITY
jgi:hypothetical protein